jgi:hypothetical protein
MPGALIARAMLLLATGIVSWQLLTLPGGAPDAQAPESPRSVLVEVFHKGHEDGAEAIAGARGIRTARGGVTLVLRDTAQDPRHQERLNGILQHFRIAPDKSPVVYACNRVLYDVRSPATWADEVRRLLQVEVFVRTGCSRCASAKRWLPSFMQSYPGLELVYRDVAAGRADAERLSALVKRHKTLAASVPVFHLCDTLVVGFDAGGSTESRLRSILLPWTHEPRAVETRAASRALGEKPRGGPAWVFTPSNAVQDPDDVAPPLPPAPQELRDDGQAGDEVALPLFGRLSAGKLGMPLFTIAVGLVDGFNPCAMWVLLLLLSILVNLEDRTRILAIAGTFVIVSGVAYLAFMAAWLNVFLFIGYLRPIQVTVAAIAILVGAVHVKDALAFKRGLSFSIPESAKPGIYARIRRIVNAEHLAGAVLGAITLAVFVNAIELLCTSGLPALYTNILMQQESAAPARYGYLALYITAYMFDDAIMVSAVVITLNRRKLREPGGRWLKLVSGMAILLLGFVMLLRPEWLQ